MPNFESPVFEGHQKGVPRRVGEQERHARGGQQSEREEKSPSAKLSEEGRSTIDEHPARLHEGILAANLERLEGSQAKG